MLKFQDDFSRRKCRKKNFRYSRRHFGMNFRKSFWINSQIPRNLFEECSNLLLQNLKKIPEKFLTEFQNYLLERYYGRISEETSKKKTVGDPAGTVEASLKKIKWNQEGIDEKTVGGTLVGIPGRTAEKSFQKVFKKTILSKILKRHLWSKENRAGCFNKLPEKLKKIPGKNPLDLSGTCPEKKMLKNFYRIASWSNNWRNFCRNSPKNFRSNSCRKRCWHLWRSLCRVSQMISWRNYRKNSWSRLRSIFGGSSYKNFRINIQKNLVFFDFQSQKGVDFHVHVITRRNVAFSIAPNLLHWTLALRLKWWVPTLPPFQSKHDSWKNAEWVDGGLFFMKLLSKKCWNLRWILLRSSLGNCRRNSRRNSC